MLLLKSGITSFLITPRFIFSRHRHLLSPKKLFPTPRSSPSGSQTSIISAGHVWQKKDTSITDHPDDLIAVRPKKPVATSPSCFFPHLSHPHAHAHVHARSVRLSPRCHRPPRARARARPRLFVHVGLLLCIYSCVRPGWREREGGTEASPCQLRVFAVLAEACLQLN